ncbi:MAG TPA: SDR family NAD(P)-dependent oxidoreductase, partial [Pyrinomonadaceae bacterium]|nr:SDR family NAD(P)-dependent oxidoreductase [Pyrinomonadaceae bacterium]
MDTNQTKRVALVTGANKGIGLETARQLAQQDFPVLLGAREEARGREAEAKLRAEGLDAHFIHLDVDRPETHETARKFVEERFGRLDALINNAAIAIDQMDGEKLVPAGETPLEIYRKTFETNFFGVIAVTQAFLL